MSVPFAVVTFLLAPWLVRHVERRCPSWPNPRSGGPAITIPFAALAFTYMGATRGLKIMIYTLFAQWIAQPIGWIVLTLGFWAIASATAGWASAGFAASWAVALSIAVAGWHRERTQAPPRADRRARSPRNGPGRCGGSARSVLPGPCSRS